MALEIAPRTDADLPALADVLVRVHANDGYPVEGVADPVAWLTPANELQSWTAYLDGEPIGQITLTRADEDDDAARLWQEHTGGDIAQLAIPVRLFIDPDKRGHGAGGQLMTTARAYAAERNLAVAFDVMLKDRDAIRLYEAAGSTRIGTIVHRHSDGLTEPAAVYLAPTGER